MWWASGSFLLGEEDLLSEDEEKQVPSEHSSVGFPDSKIEHQIDRQAFGVFCLFVCLIGWLTNYLRV